MINFHLFFEYITSEPTCFIIIVTFYRSIYHIIVFLNFVGNVKRKAQLKIRFRLKLHLPISNGWGKFFPLMFRKKFPYESDIFL